MSKLGKSNIPIFSPEEAAIHAVSSAKRLEELDLPECFAGGKILDSIRSAIAAREAKGFHADPQCREEINGLVNSAMGDFDHLKSVRKELWHFIVGLLQTNDALMAQARTGIISDSTEAMK